MNKNFVCGLLGVELYLCKLLHPTMVRVLWGQAELMVISMDGELIARYDCQFPEVVTYLSLKHAIAKLQNMPVGE
ncbi:hypothetical protein [Glutamicibacter sp. NPDC087344]|uniref:hypothetical protein n=1 Tax=Glutamicibacter sp. NPDC087344 TaxID=3363994 RepID=UPI0038255269